MPCPSGYDSEVCEVKGIRYAIVGNVRGLLAVYRVADDGGLHSLKNDHRMYQYFDSKCLEESITGQSLPGTWKPKATGAAVAPTGEETR